MKIGQVDIAVDRHNGSLALTQLLGIFKFTVNVTAENMQQP